MAKWIPVAVFEHKHFRKEFFDMFLNVLARDIAAIIDGHVRENRIDPSDVDLDKLIKQFFEDGLETASEYVFDVRFDVNVIFEDFPANRFYRTGLEIFSEIPNADRRLKVLVSKYLKKLGIETMPRGLSRVRKLSAHMDEGRKHYADVFIDVEGGPRYDLYFELGIMLERSAFYHKWLPSIKDVFVEEVVDRLYKNLANSPESYSEDLFERIAHDVLQEILEIVCDENHIEYVGTPDCIVLPSSPSSSYRGSLVIRDGKDFWKVLTVVYKKSSLLEEIEFLLRDEYDLDVKIV